MSYMRSLSETRRLPPDASKTLKTAPSNSSLGTPNLLPLLLLDDSNDFEDGVLGLGFWITYTVFRHPEPASAVVPVATARTYNGPRRPRQLPRNALVDFNDFERQPRAPNIVSRGLEHSLETPDIVVQDCRTSFRCSSCSYNSPYDDGS
ncbi:hypothetical protein G7046_g7059 [Stylonectria norvegica]|nr:hypothetical protein G7046_g7059 [Stylonectria norvegica]